jgi:hypothetical protein
MWLNARSLSEFSEFKQAEDVQEEDDEEEEEGSDMKEGFGWVKYGRSRHRRGLRRNRGWYPYFRYSGYPYWRFIRYPYYGSPYQTVRYDGDYWMVTV